MNITELPRRVKASNMYLKCCCFVDNHPKATLFALMFFIILLALFIRGYYFFQQDILLRDEISYIEQIQLWHAGDYTLWFERRHPMPYLFFAVCDWLMDCGLSVEYAAGSVNIAGTVLLLVGVWFLGLLVTSQKHIALLAMLIAAVTPHYVRLSCAVMRENLSVPLYIWFFCFFVLWQKSHRFIYLLWALSLAILTIFTRYEAMELLFFLGVGIITDFLYATRDTRKVIIKHGLLLVMACGVIFFIISCSEFNQIFFSRILVLLKNRLQ